MTDYLGISDANLLLDQLGDLQQVQNDILRVKESLSSCCDQIGAAWQSDTIDKQSYLESINKNLYKMDLVNQALNILVADLTSYATDLIRTANNG